MYLSEYLLTFVCLSLGTVGALFLLFPGAVPRLESRLNAPWGDLELFSIRFGLRGEMAAEKALNRAVLARNIVWDRQLRAHPRLTGLALCLAAALLYWLGDTV